MYYECRESQELRDRILARTLDILGSRVGREVVWKFSLSSKRTVELHRHGTAIQRDWSSCVHKHQCLELWNLEAEES